MKQIVCVIAFAAGMISLFLFLKWVVPLLPIELTYFLAMGIGFTSLGFLLGRRHGISEVCSQPQEWNLATEDELIHLHADYEEWPEDLETVQRVHSPPRLG